MQNSVLVCVYLSVIVNVNWNRKWPVSQVLAPALSPSCWSICTHKQAHRHVHRHTDSWSSCLWWPWLGLKAPHGFHIHSSPHPLPSERAASSSSFFYPLFTIPCILLMPCTPSFHFHHGHRVTNVLNPNPRAFPASATLSGQWYQSPESFKMVLLCSAG